MVVSKRSGINGQSGVTLIELLVVIIVIAILAAFAFMQRGSANEQFQRQNAALQLKVALERARFDSVKRRATGSEQALVTVTPTSFTLRTFNNGTAQDVTTTVPAGIVMGLYGGGSLVSQDVVFNQRGETSVSPNAPQFYICNVSCSSPGNSTANLLIVTPTGTVNLLPGGAGLPSFGVPTMSNVNTSTGVSNTVVIP